MRPGRTVRPDRSIDPGVVGGRLAGSEDRLDAAVGDQHLAVGEHLARVDVEDPRLRG